MLRFILDVLLLRRLIDSPGIRRFVLVAIALLALVAFAYTLNLFVTLPERTSGHYVQHHSSN